jgi:chaperonin GroES
VRSLSTRSISREGNEFGQLRLLQGRRARVPQEGWHASWIDWDQEEMTMPKKKGKPVAKVARTRAQAKLRPLRDRVVVRRKEEAEQKVGSIVVPDSAREKPQEAEVVAVGPGRLSEEGKVLPLDLKTGDRVLIGKWSGTEVTVGSEELLILKEDEILGVLE